MMFSRLGFYLRVWLRFTLGTFQVAFVSRIGAALFTFAKILRFVFFIIILVLVVSQTKTLAGYDLSQSIIFFLTFNVIDTLTQFLFRDVYRFRQFIISGYFDYILIKPMSPLFKVLFGGADPLDLIMLVPYVAMLTFFVSKAHITAFSLVIYLLLTINALLIATAFHVAVLAFGIITLEIDHTILIYRDLTSMARFPVDIYREPLRGFITFIIPVGIMMTFPPKALFGLLSPWLMIISGGVGCLFFILSLKLWRYALTQYASASS